MTVENKEPAAFENLLGELTGTLENMAKALPEVTDDDGDNKIQAAAGEGEGDGATAKKDGEGDETMGKSLTVTLESGETVEATDGTELVKSLIERIDGNESVMSKAMGVAVDLIKAQGEHITKLTKSLNAVKADVAAMSNEGRGRKTTVSVHEKPAQPLAKSEPEGIDSKEFMAKAMTALNAGKLSGLDVATVEACLNRGEAVPAQLVARVMQ